MAEPVQSLYSCQASGIGWSIAAVMACGSVCQAYACPHDAKRDMKLFDGHTSTPFHKFVLMPALHVAQQMQRLDLKLKVSCRDIAAHESAVSSLQDEVSRLKRDRRRMQKAAEAAEGEAAALRPALAQAQQRCTQVHRD